MHLAVTSLLSVSFNISVDLIVALLFGALLTAAGMVWWQNMRARRMQELHDLMIAQTQAELQELQDLLKESQQKSSDLLAQIDVQKNTINDSINIQTNDAESPESEPLKQDLVFYMPQPNRNGRFLESGRHSDAEKAIYAFHPDADNPAVASFEFVAQDLYLQVALGNAPTWINSACDRNNLPGANTTQVKTLSPGQAVLHGDEWEITRKAKITYL